MVALSLICIGVLSAAAGDGVQQRWSEEKAWAWYKAQPWIVGCNFLPSTAVNDVEMWQAETFDPKTIDRELGMAEDLGLNSVRVFLNYVVWEADPDGLKKRFEQFLKIADKHGISVTPIFFDDCNFAGKEPKVGKQDDPVPGLCNRGWVPSPGKSRVLDLTYWPDLEKYVKDMVGSFRNDRRILIWDLYNEPETDESRPLMEAVFAWAREMKPLQPLTVGAWRGVFSAPIQRRMMELSDIISFHGYEDKDGIKAKLTICDQYGRPVICTEWLCREKGNPIENIMPIFLARKIGCYNWGLVAGRTQTYFHWGSQKGAPEPAVWKHDLLRRDGSPYNADETAIIKQLTGRLKVSPEKSSFRGWNSQRLGNWLVELQIVPEISGRVIQLTMGNKEFLWVNPQLAGKLPPEGGVGPDNAWLNYGGDKLWPAPQGWDNAEQWPGPPDAVLDGGAYEMKVLSSGGGKASVLLTSGKDKRSGIQFSRVISVYDGSTRVSFEATMKNIDTKPRRWGIWAHTQLDGRKKGGGCNTEMNAYCPLNPKSHFTNGYSVIFGDEKNPSFQPDAAKNLMRVQYQYKVGKIGLDSPAGWVATVDGISGKVFVQRFVFEQGSEYPDGSSVEFWLNGLGSFKAWGKDNVMPADPVKNPYVFESEVLSPFAKLQPGESYTWKYDWYLTSIGAGKSEVVDCTSAGVVAEPLSAKVENGKIRLKGRFGVFAQGTLVVVVKDAQGKDVERNKLIEGVFPVIPVVIDQAVAMPAGTASVSLVLVDGAGTDTGKIAEAEVN
jgi:hypothetical protein